MTQETATDTKLLDVRNVCVDYLTDKKLVRAVDHVSLDIKRGETLGLAGESGCGKSTLAFSIARLHKPPALISEGEIEFEGEDVLCMDDERLRSFRWNEVSVVLQSAMNCMNPVLTVGEQITDVLMAHHPILYEESKARKVKEGQMSIPKFAQQPFSNELARVRAKELLKIVGIHPDRLDDYPHQFSGGMRQRAVIAMTLALDPKMIIMDEPTTALDVVVERDIMAELAELKEKFGFTILIISHDLSLMGEISDRIGVMYGGRMAEISTSEKIIYEPKHPYTVGLIDSFPLLSEGKKKLTGIGGNPVNLFDPPSGCYFWARCGKCMDVCKTDIPPLIDVESDRKVACHLYS